MRHLVGKLLWYFVGQFFYDEIDREIDFVTKRRNDAKKQLAELERLESTSGR